MRRMRGLAAAAALQGLLRCFAGEPSLPTVTQQEAALLERVDALARTNTVAAVAHLRANMPERRPGAALSYTLGNLLTRQGRHLEAVESYEAALESRPEFTLARIGRGRALALAGQWQRAEEVVRPLARDDAATAEVLLLHGTILLNLEHLVSAETAFRRAASASGEGTEALHGLAQCFLRQQRHPETEALARELVHRHPDEPSYWALWADAWLALDQPREAAVRLEAARRQGAATPEMLVRLADLLLEQSLPDDVRATYEALLHQPDLPPETLLRMAEGLLLAGATEAAECALDRGRDALATLGDQAPPALQTAYWRVEARRAEQRNDAEARLKALREWVARDPLDAAALTLLGDAYHAMDDGAAARLWYERAADLAAGDPTPRLRLAQLALDARDFATALAWLEDAHREHADPDIERSIRQIRRIEGSHTPGAGSD